MVLAFVLPWRGGGAIRPRRSASLNGLHSNLILAPSLADPASLGALGFFLPPNKTGLAKVSEPVCQLAE